MPLPTHHPASHLSPRLHTYAPLPPPPPSPSCPPPPGVRDLKVLKTTQSGYEGYLKDEYTLLGETRDRIMATSVTATWKVGFSCVCFVCVGGGGVEWPSVQWVACAWWLSATEGCRQGWGQLLYALGQGVCSDVPPAPCVRDQLDCSPLPPPHPPYTPNSMPTSPWTMTPPSPL